MPAAATYDFISTETLASTASIVNIGGITSAYTDFVLSCFVRSTAALGTTDLLLRFNVNAGNAYDGGYMTGNGSAATAARYTNSSYAAPMGIMAAGNLAAGIFSSALITAPGYSNTTTYKNAHCLSGSDYNGGGNTMLAVNTYGYTVAITNIQLLPASGNFAVGSSFTLYGIKAA